jgi:N-methylhydantoinase B
MTTENSRIDPITTEVIRHRLLSVANEMATNLMRTAYNTIVYEIKDFGVGVYDREGRMLAEAPGLTIFTRANDRALNKLIAFIGIDNFEEGDAYIFNYPYWSAAHTLDVFVSSPIFASGKLVGFSGVRIHWLDLKQKHAGYSMDTTDMYQEGLVFPGTRIYRRGELQTDIVNILKFNSRLPERVLGDMFAQISACRIGEKRMAEIVDRYGLDVFDQANRQIMEHGERMARIKLAELPRGSWTAEDYVDGDGIEDRLVKMKATVTISADEMVVDWTGTDPTTKGPINLPFGLTESMSSVIFKGITTPDTPANDGDFRPLRVIAPEGTLMNAQPPAPTFTLWPGLLMGEVILKALAQGMPDRIPASSGCDVCSMMGLGMNPRNDRFWLEATNEAVGFGGHAGGDGENAIMHLTEPGARNNPVEVLETKSPMFISHYGMRQDSGGPGKHRGGLGVGRTYHFLADAVSASIVYKTSTRPWAIGEGVTGENNHVIMNPGTDKERIAGGHYRPVSEGDVLVNNSGGGGGWGDPFERDSAAVLEDVLDGYISAEAAAREYGVAVDAAAETIDAEETARLRAGPRPPEPLPIGHETKGRRPLITPDL